MKLINRLGLLTITAISLATFKVEAAQTERPITFALTGFFQTNRLGNFVAAPFRISTKDILVEISLTTGQDFTNGVLLQIESLDNTNGPIQVVRKGTNELDISQFFDFQFGEFVSTETATRGTFYAIDYFAFSTTNVDTNGLSIQIQGFTKELLASVIRQLGNTSFNIISSNFRTDGVGELRFIDGFVGPIKGNIRIGPPKLVGSPALSQSAVMQLQAVQKDTPIPLLPLPE